MISTESRRLRKFRRSGLLVPLFLICILSFTTQAPCETFGIKDQSGNFVPKVTITVGRKEVVIKKTDPQAKFNSIALTLNSKYHKLINNVTSLNVEWVNDQNRPGMPLPFAGPLYTPATRVYQAPMTRSVSLKLLDKSKVNLFVGKSVADLFTISVDGQRLISAETIPEQERTVHLGTGREVSINVDKTSITFDENNLMKGEWLNVDNRSGTDQIIGVELPEKDLVYAQIVRKPEQKPIPRADWNRFTLASDSGIGILLFPEPNPTQLAQLNGKEIVIKIYQGNRVKDTRKIPIKTAAGLQSSGKELTGGGESIQSSGSAPPSQPEVAPSRGAEPIEASAPPRQGETASPSGPSRTNRQSGNLWLWIILIFGLVLLAGLAAYTVFFMLPKVQVLEDRLVKNEMFIHGVREAVREEMDRIKADILGQCQEADPHKDPAQE
ncbi:MAG: hypothetical protein WBG50_06435 [Desulfomonilaceae bacterium]